MTIVTLVVILSGVAILVSVSSYYLFLAFQSKPQKDPFRTKFCNAEGVCGESPTLPSPRTIYSTNSAESYHAWFQCHEGLNQAALLYAQQRRQYYNGQSWKNNTDVDSAQDPLLPIEGNGEEMDKLSSQPISTQQRSRPFIFLGDSITMNWAERRCGGNNPSSPLGVGFPVLQELVKEFQLLANNDTQNQQQQQLVPLDPLVLGLGGDHTQHLLWRLQNGNLQPEFANDPETLFVVMIGTNNIGSGMLPGPSATGVLTILQYLLDHTKGTILYLYTTPRGDIQKLRHLCPPRCQTTYDNKNTKHPFESFFPFVDQLNEHVEQGMDTLRPVSRVWPVHCGEAFVLHKERQERVVNTSLMPDALHPNTMGHRNLAKCIQQTMLEKL